MRDDNFEWDDKKAASYRRKHGISFELARGVFEDARGFERPDMDESDEERFLVTGFAGDRMLTVVFVHRGSRIRIISARKAPSREQNDYDGQIR